MVTAPILVRWKTGWLVLHSTALEVTLSGTLKDIIIFTIFKKGTNDITAVYRRLWGPQNTTMTEGGKRVGGSRAGEAGNGKEERKK